MVAYLIVDGTVDQTLRIHGPVYNFGFDQGLSQSPSLLGSLRSRGNDICIRCQPVG